MSDKFFDQNCLFKLILLILIEQNPVQGVNLSKMVKDLIQSVFYVLFSCRFKTLVIVYFFQTFNDYVTDFSAPLSMLSIWFLFLYNYVKEESKQGLHRINVVFIFKFHIVFAVNFRFVHQNTLNIDPYNPN